ncbi:hypothetical protein GQ53DRAFT_690366 [Thozetella sp. PMI_491]|nr:hypothetical protein GQ53DRAFT_690366 [Thozetella sp. PMI_491]
MSEPSDTTTASGARRKWHTKSRTGCGPCKSRKIKCDEQRPACRNCLRKGVECDFVRSPPIQTSTHESSRLSLELLHNFTVSTAATLSSETEVLTMWRVLVPQIALTTDYILDGIFALSALHIARYNPERQELVARATEYHSSSLAKALPLISSVTAQNCSQLFLFGLLTLFFSLAKPKNADDILLVGNGVVPEWLYLLRGMHVLREANSAILSSPVSLIFQTTASSFEFWCSHSPRDHEALNDLDELINKNTANDPSKRKTLVEAVTALKRSYTFLFSAEELQLKEEDRLRGFYTWLFLISDSYLKLLKNADGEALCVLAFYTVLVKHLEKYWWVEGWAVHVIKRIYMLLDPTHRLWIRWPIEQLGWVP